jgi:hypothetical protein
MKNLFLVSFLALAFVVSFSAAQEKITNGTLETGTTDGWSFQTGGTGVAAMEASAVNPISGGYSLHVTITTAGTSGWHIQLCNLMGVVDGKKYVITFKARASKDTMAAVQIQQNHDPYGTLYNNEFAFTTSNQSYADSVINTLSIGTDADSKLTIWLGTISTGTEFWFDDVSIIEMAAPKVEVGLKAPGVEKITNGLFESGVLGWSLEVSGGAVAGLDASTINPIQGTTSARVQVTTSTGTASDIQLIQYMSVTADKRYYTMYKARSSDSGLVISGGIQENHDAYNTLTHFRGDTLRTVIPVTCLDTSGYLAADDGFCKFTIHLGTAPAGTDIWIDFVTVIENTMAPTLGIMIDGSKDAWYDGLTNPEDGKIFMPCRAYLRDIGSAPTNNPGTNANLSATVWTAWDRDYLYYYAEVNDDWILDNNATNWNNDKLELKFNPDPTIISTSGALQVGMSALGVGDVQDPGALDNLDADDNLYYANRTVWQSTYEDYARAEMAGGYILEWRLPLNVIINSTGTQRLSPGIGGKFGVCLNVADNDDTQRSRMIQWSSGMADNAWANPQKHGTVTFLANNMLKWEAISPQVPETYHNDSASIWYYGALGPSTGVNGPYGQIPGTYALGQNYPNPFNPSTAFKFTVPERSDVRIVLINMLGQVVKEIVKGNYSAGTYDVSLNASDLASGVYFYKLQAGTFIEVKKLILLK